MRLTSNGDVNVDALAGGVTVASVTAKDAISISASGGDAILGEAHLLGTGANQLLVNASGAGRNAILGSVLASGVTAANVFTSDGATTTAQVSSANGDAFVHLDTSDALTLVSGAGTSGSSSATVVSPWARSTPVRMRKSSGPTSRSPTASSAAP